MAVVAMTAGPVVAGEGVVWRYADDEGALHIVADKGAVPKRFVAAARPVALTSVTEAADAPAATFRLSSPADVPMTLSHGKPVVATRFDGAVVRPAAIDTGSQMTAVTSKLARALGIDLTKARLGRFATPSGSVTAPMVTLGRISWGGRVWAERVTAAVLDYPGKSEYSALIGMNALNGFVFEVDAVRGRLRFLTVRR